MRAEYMDMVFDKRVLMVTPHLKDMGGVANYCNSVLPLLGEKQFRVEHLEIGSSMGKGRCLYPFFDQLNFLKYINHSPPALVHVNPSLNLKSFIRDGFFIFQAKQHQIPVVVFFHGWKKEFAEFLEKYLLFIFERTYGKADAFIVLSSEFKKKLVSWKISAPIYLETTTVDPCLLVNYDIAERVKSLREKKKLRILFLSRLENTKGIFETIDAVAMLSEKKVPVTLSIAGDGSAKNAIRTYVKSLDLSQETVNFLGYVKEESKISVFSTHDLYCLPSYYGEGLPISLLEALAFGLPVITCAVGGLVDVFQNGKMGAFVPVRDANAIADQIELMNNDRESMVRMARYNHAFAIKNFLAPKVASRLNQIYLKTV